MTLNISPDVTITNINATLARGGWECRFTSLSDTDVVERWHHVVAKWRGAFGGPPGPERTAFSGYVLPQRFQFDRTGSQADFVAQTSDGFLRRGWLQGLSFAEVPTRSHYHEFSAAGAASANMDEWMTLGKIVKHILGYYDNEGAPPASNPDWVAHTNLVYHPTQNPHGWISLDNVELTDSAHVTRYIVRETDNIWSRLREIARNEFYEILFDKTDTLWYQPHPMYLAALPPPVMTFDEDFCTVPPTVEVRDVDTLRQVILHALTDTGDPVKRADGTDVRYPVTPLHTYGNVLDISRIRCNDWNVLQLWAERKFKFENRPFTVRWTAPGLCGLLFEILDRVQITYAGTAANGVHIDWDERKFWIHSITVTPDAEFGGLSTFVLEAENV